MTGEEKNARAQGFVVKDSGVREEYPSGMRRDTQEGKPDYALVFDGPLIDRLAEHLTKGAEKYGKRNWQLAQTAEEAERFKASAARHFRQWFRGDLDEDHFAAVVFNMNAYEYVTAQLDFYLLDIRDELDRLRGKAVRKKRDHDLWKRQYDRDTLPLKSARKCCGDHGDCSGPCK